jgi:hypothetical protein
MLKQLLNSGVVKVTFTKKDGTIREMKCTTQSELVGISTYSLAPSSSELIVVWDLEKDAWRSFKLDSVITYEKSNVS